MTDGIWIAIIGGLVTILVAGVPGIWRLWKSRNDALDRAIDKARAEALAQARNEALLRESEAALAAKNIELATEKQVRTELEARLVTSEEARSQLRDIVDRMSRGEVP